MSKFFKALDQAERDNTQQESPSTPEATAEAAVSERPSLLTRRPEPDKEQPPAFRAPPSPPSVEAPRPFVKTPRPSAEASRPVVEFTRPVVDQPRIASALLDEHLVSLQAPSTAAAEQYRVLRHFVETLRKRSNLQILGVTSPSVGDGALAQSDDTRVVLMDMDLRGPSVAPLSGHHRDAEDSRRRAGLAGAGAQGRGRPSAPLQSLGAASRNTTTS
jgi:Mrp family chromosome partitioning ATPase